MNAEDSTLQAPFQTIPAEVCIRLTHLALIGGVPHGIAIDQVYLADVKTQHPISLGSLKNDHDSSAALAKSIAAELHHELDFQFSRAIYRSRELR